MRQQPERLSSFVLKLVLALVLAFVAWAYVEPFLMTGLFALSQALWPTMFFDSPGAHLSLQAEAWRLHTGWPLLTASGQPTRAALAMIELRTIRRTLGGFPLLAALLAVSSARRPGRIAIGASLLFAAAWLSTTAIAWHTLVIMRGTEVSFIDASDVPPPFRLAMAAAPHWQYYLSGYLKYLAVLTIPFVAPVLLWAALCRREVMGLLQTVRRKRNR